PAFSPRKASLPGIDPMENPTTPQLAPAAMPQLAENVSAAPEEPSLAFESWLQNLQQRRWLAWSCLGIAIVALAAAVYGLAPHGGAGTRPAQAQPSVSWPTDHNEEEEAPPLAVNTIVPHRKTLVRTLEQPGSIKPWAEAELHAKTSGYLKRLAREPVTRERIIEWITQNMAMAGQSCGATPLGQFASVIGGCQIAG